MSQSITLPENMTIHYAAEHMNFLNEELLSAEGEIVFDVSAVETIDSAGMQLLLVVIQSLNEKGLTVQWSNLNDLFVDSVRNIGLADSLQLPQ